ncbi:MAG: hypothetical protein RLO52_09785 [Sandaracinaceae bacterium]|nr:MAG: hypothetical protein EVA89_35735 [Sandaracinaceae bacterium]HBQ16480.1 hypothetical protein [Myxococcales bacterium]
MAPLRLTPWLAAALVTAALLVGPTAVAAAQDAEIGRLIEEGRARYRELEYLDAIDVLRRALASETATDAQRAEALEVLGATYVILDRDREARETFEELFAIDPYHPVREPTGSPKIARFVARVRAELVPDAALDPDVQLRAELPRAGRVGEDLPLRFRVSPPAAIRRVRLFWRGAEGQAWTGLDAAPEGDATFTLTLPARPRSDQLELYALGRDESERVVARAGSPLAPLALPVTLEESGSVLTEWWLWTAIGGGVALAIVLGVALGVSSGQSAPSGTLPPGRVELP